jgi:hypothetical protein
MSGFLSHLVRRTLSPETAVRPLRPRRFVGEAPPAVEANRPAREGKFDPADETRAIARGRATLAPAGIEELDEAPRPPAAEPRPRPTADRQEAPGPAPPRPPIGPVRSITVAIEAVEDGRPVVRPAPARERPHAPAAEPRLEQVKPRRRRHLVEEADELVEPIAGHPPTAAQTARPVPSAAKQGPARASPAAEAPCDEAPTARAADRPRPVIQVVRPVEAPSAIPRPRAAATTTAEPEAGSASSPPPPAPGLARRPAQAELAAPRGALAPSLRAPRGALAPSLRVRRPEAHRAKATPPDVHITIGRVEIRSVAAIAAPERQAKPAPRPVESLADYLARRDGQRR